MIYIYKKQKTNKQATRMNLKKKQVLHEFEPTSFKNLLAIFKSYLRATNWAIAILTFTH